MAIEIVATAEARGAEPVGEKPIGQEFADVDVGDAITTWCNDAEWEKLSGRLPMGAWRRLMKADRALCSALHLSQMLFADSLGRTDMMESGARFNPLTLCDAQLLTVAALGLQEYAAKLMGEVREGHFA